MRDQLIPTSLREAISEALERLGARVAILRYLDGLPAEERAPDHAGFSARLQSERDTLMRLINGVPSAWQEGVLPLADASAILRNAATFPRT